MDPLNDLSTRMGGPTQVLLDRYEVLGPLGRGGMGEVLHVRDRLTGLEVAVKRVPDEATRSSEDFEDLVDTFRKVARLSHPHIAACRHVERDASTGQVYLVMEFVPGTTLARVVKRNGPMAEARALALLSPVAAALDHAHAQGILHRDVKPRNIMVTPSDQAKLIDFGLAADIRSSLVRRSQVLSPEVMAGTLPYMAPEAWLGRQPKPATDQWALACTLYEALAGHAPFEGDSEAILRPCILGEAPERPAGASDAAWARLQRAFSKSPEDRWPRCADLFEGDDRAGHATATASAAARIRFVEVRTEVEVLAGSLGTRVADLLPDASLDFRKATALAEEGRTQDPAREGLAFLEEALRRLQDLDRRCGDVEEARRKARDDEERARVAAIAKAQEEARRQAEDDARRQEEEQRTLREAAQREAEEAERHAALAAERRLKRVEARVVTKAFAGGKAVVEETGLIFRRTEVHVRWDPATYVTLTTIQHHQVDGHGNHLAPIGDFLPVPAGSFRMGSDANDPRRHPDETPAHDVRLSRPFELLRTPVTVELFRTLAGWLPEGCAGDTYPVVNLSWYQAAWFCNDLSRAVGLPEAYAIDGRGRPEDPQFTAAVRWKGPDVLGYRLPTEAEWEYACRAGTTTPTYGPLEEIAWHEGNAGGSPHPVGGQAANAWGLHDLLGNVWEWVWDAHDLYHEGTFTDPGWPTEGPERVCRGGSWRYGPNRTRSAHRGQAGPHLRFADVGFRLARTIG